MFRTLLHLRPDHVREPNSHSAVGCLVQLVLVTVVRRMLELACLWGVDEGVNNN